MPVQRNAHWFERVLGASGLSARVAAELGVGNRGFGGGAHLGGTSHVLARTFRETHVFDFDNVLDAQLTRMRALNTTGRYGTIVAHANSHLQKDSYTYSLKVLLRQPRSQRPTFDYVYIDGAHEWHHDGFAFLLLDKMLNVGGVVELDDYDWSISNSPTVNPAVRPKVALEYTPSQIAEAQVKEIVDLLIKGNPRYVELLPNRIYRKISSEYEQP